MADKRVLDQRKPKQEQASRRVLLSGGRHRSFGSRKEEGEKGLVGCL